MGWTGDGLGLVWDDGPSLRNFIGFCLTPLLQHHPDKGQKRQKHLLLRASPPSETLQVGLPKPRDLSWQAWQTQFTPALKPRKTLAKPSQNPQKPTHTHPPKQKPSQTHSKPWQAWQTHFTPALGVIRIDPEVGGGIPSVSDNII